ncbi:MAG: hypothetical protein JST31_17305, partial [Actinobacteria bacterium]|nr:hypothetical protein [Actinomycetota bacterium]
MAVPGGADTLASFAEAHRLGHSAHADLPAQGATLTRSTGHVEGAATGILPGGAEGTLAHFVYTYTYTDADDHTHTETRRLTLVVTEIPVSIGFVPYLGFSRGSSHFVATASGTKMRRIDLSGSPELKHAACFIYAGTNERWQAQLFSPALLDWLARSEDDFGFELANGVLVAGRSSYLNKESELTALCEDASHLAAAIGEEAQETVDTGGAEANAAKDTSAGDPRMEKALATAGVAAPQNLGGAAKEYRGYVARSPQTLFRAVWTAALLTLVLNVPGAAIPIVLAVQGAYALLAIIEGVVFLVCFYFLYRSNVKGNGRKYAEEAFFRGYASSRGLTLEEPLRFAATHADAKLPFKPDRVMTGPLPGGGEGSLVLTGDGSKRSDRIAVVGGPAGPVAESELQAEAPGLSTKDLDTYLGQLAGEVREAQQAAGGAAAQAAAAGS